jgi:hypothetical protein
MRVSWTLIAALKQAKRPAWKIAAEADINPATLSRLINGSLRPRVNDERLLRVGRILGVPADQVFEPPRAPAMDEADTARS